MADGYPQNPPLERFHSLVETIPGIVVYLDVVQPDDPSCSIPIYISPQVEDLLGYPREAWMTEDELWLDVLHPDDRERMIAADTHARGTLSSLFEEYRMIARDGRIVWVSEKATVVTDDKSGTSYWQGVMLDITDRRNAEEGLAASERKYRSVFDAATIGLMTLSRDGTVLEANAAVEHVLGYSPGTLVGVELWSGLDQRTLATIDAIARGREERCELELELRRWNGATMWCRIVLALVRDGSGRPDRITAMVEDIDERKRLEADLLHRTTHDALTRLPNREHFYARLREARVEARSLGLGLGVVFIDMDNFKEINDSLGHDAGDDLLRAVAGRLRAGVRPSDVVARYGGDEFLVLVDAVADARDVAQLAWRLANALRAPFELGGTTATVSASFGVAYSNDPDEPEEDLVRKADAAMYGAKRPGSNRVVVFGDAGSTGAVA
jgi:diguanylate cyclase (GGDEF)-like protein/PAS domain S-box-containing protein